MCYSVCAMSYVVQIQSFKNVVGLSFNSEHPKLTLNNNNYETILPLIDAIKRVLVDEIKLKLTILP